MRRTVLAIVFFSAVPAIFSFGAARGAAALTADHHSADDFSNIPSDYFAQVRSKFNIYYGHTSHGSQLITGVNMLDLYAPPSIYDDYRIDLGDSAWESDTRNYLNNHPQTNLAIWSWFGQLSDYGPSEVNNYLNRMNSLEGDYPDVDFVHMTGHLDGGGPSGTLYANNSIIRSYCTTDNKVLYDFADVESYNPMEGDYDGTVTLSQSKALILRGGWNDSYSTQSPNRTLIRAPQVTAGSLTFQVVNIIP